MILAVSQPIADNIHKYTHSFAPKSINLQYKILQTIKLKLVNEKLHIGMVSWREIYIFYPKIIQLNPEVDRGRLVYRLKVPIKGLAISK